MSKRKKPGRGAPRASRTDWVAARDRWVYSFTLTLDDIAEEFGVAVSTVRRRSSLEKWGDLRREAKEQQLTKVASEGLKRAFEHRAEAVEALLRVEYMESLSHAQQMQALRKTQGASWTPGSHKAHADAMGVVFSRIRLSLGLPTDITKSSVDMSIDDRLTAIEKDLEDGLDGAL